MAPSDVDRVWQELRDLRSRVDRLALAVVALAALVGGVRLADTLSSVIGMVP